MPANETSQISSNIQSFAYSEKRIRVLIWFARHGLASSDVAALLKYLEDNGFKELAGELRSAISEYKRRTAEQVAAEVSLNPSFAEAEIDEVIELVASDAESDDVSTLRGYFENLDRTDLLEDLERAVAAHTPSTRFGP